MRFHQRGSLDEMGDKKEDGAGKAIQQTSGHSWLSCLEGIMASEGGLSEFILVHLT